MNTIGFVKNKLQLFKMIMLIVLFIPMNSYGAQSGDMAVTSKAVIEAFDSETQTIIMLGKTYKLAPNVEVYANNREMVGQRGLKKGLTIEYVLDPNGPAPSTTTSTPNDKTTQKNMAESNKPLPLITQIRILSDIDKSQWMH